MNRWTLTTSDIAQLIRNAKIEPWLGSPLRRLEISPPSAAASLTQTTPEMLEAVSRIARPEVVLGLVNYPPEEPEFSWFYGPSGGQNFALYQERDVDGYDIIWPINGQDLFETVDSSLALGQPAVNQGISFFLDRNGFETMVAIIDIIQEDALVAFLNRMPPQVSRFNAVSLIECCYRTLQQTDLRWMVYRIKFISPTDFVPSLENIGEGLETLREKGLLMQNGYQYSPTKRFGLICSQLSACHGFCGLSTRRRTTRPIGESAWDHQHMAALRGINSLWLLEFTDIISTDFSVRVSDVTPGLLRDRLYTGLLLPKTQVTSPPPLKEMATIISVPKPEASRVSPSPPPPISSPQPKLTPRVEVHCPKCGAAVSPNVNFCTQCGAPVRTVPSSAKTPETPIDRICSKCGARVRQGMKFCTECGSPVV
jgi:hypothetical protein